MARFGIPSLEALHPPLRRLHDPASLGISGPAVDAPRPPALFVVNLRFVLYGASLSACAYRIEQCTPSRLYTAHLENRLFQLPKGENHCLSLYLSGGKRILSFEKWVNSSSGFRRRTGHETAPPSRRFTKDLECLEGLESLVPAFHPS